MKTVTNRNKTKAMKNETKEKKHEKERLDRFVLTQMDNNNTVQIFDSCNTQSIRRYRGDTVIAE